MWFFKVRHICQGRWVLFGPRVKQHSYATASTSDAWCCYVSGRTLTPPPLWLQKHNNWHAHDFAHSLILPAPKAGDHMELLLPYSFLRYENMCWRRTEVSKIPATSILSAAYNGSSYIPMQRRQISTSLRGTTSKTTIFFTSIVVKTSSTAMI